MWACNKGQSASKIEKNEKNFKKVLTNHFYSAIIGSNLNITKNDCDEEGWKVMLTESCRLVQDNGSAIRITYRF